MITAPTFLEGDGFHVRRPTAGIDLSLADPFLLLDQMGAVEYAPGEAKGASDHPHRGFETVTYMMDGKIKHRDSNGGGGDHLEIAASDAQDTRSPAMDVLLLGGLPIREQIAWYGPFVMNDRQEILQAIDDYRAGRMGAIPAGPAKTVHRNV